jgi:hypothetical protein
VEEGRIMRPEPMVRYKECLALLFRPGGRVEGRRVKRYEDKPFKLIEMEALIKEKWGWVEYVVCVGEVPTEIYDKFPMAVPDDEEPKRFCRYCEGPLPAPFVFFHPSCYKKAKTRDEIAEFETKREAGIKPEVEGDFLWMEKRPLKVCETCSEDCKVMIRADRKDEDARLKLICKKLGGLKEAEEEMQEEEES